ncbi:MAG: helix-turn-helix domain-containing protein [Clostridiales bacterium]|nr:helix-turn-helix domain-containing protein [Clostridiales bacterium]
MNQIKVGQLITKKRKEKNLTQEQLAERLNVSNKTISKWECGKCMPDYSLIEPLCKALDISISELLDGEEREKDTSATENEQIIKLIKDVEQLKKEKSIPKLYVSAIILVVIGIALCLLSTIFGGSALRDFISGFLVGVAIDLILIGLFMIFFAIFSAIKKNKRL